MATVTVSQIPESESAVAPVTVKSKTPPTKKPPAHPTYLQMSTDAILALKERTGSSTYAIAKWLEAKYKDVLPRNFKKLLHHQLKNQVQKGKLIQIKNSYKLSEELKKCVKSQSDKGLNTKKCFKSESDKCLNTDETNTLVPPKKSSRTKTSTVQLKKVTSSSKVASKNTESTKVPCVTTKKPAIKTNRKLSRKASSKPENKKAKVPTKSECRDVKASVKPVSKASKTSKDSKAVNGTKAKVTKSTATKGNAKKPVCKTKKKSIDAKKTSKSVRKTKLAKDAKKTSKSMKKARC